MKFASIKCCCNPPCNCYEFADFFGRPDSTNLGADWTEVVGDWEIVSGQVIVSDSLSQLIHVSVCPVEFVGTTLIAVVPDGAEVRVIIGWVDDENYLYAQVDRGSAGTLKIGKVVASADTVIVTTDARSINDNFDLSVCIRNGQLSAIMDDGQLLKIATLDAHGDFTATTAGGVGTGSGTPPSAIGFDHVEMSVLHGESVECWECETCDYIGDTVCTNDVAREQYDLTFGNGFSAAGCCVNGTLAIGTVTLDYEPTAAQARCMWTYGFECTADGNTFQFYYALSFVTCTTLRVTLYRDGIAVITWQKTGVTSRDGPNTLTRTSDTLCLTSPNTVVVEAT